MSDLTFKLLNWQREVLQDDTRFKVICAGRRCGKSRLAAVTLILKGLVCPSGSGVMYVAPTQGQARVIIWQLLLDLGRDVIQSSHVNNSEIVLVNGATIYVRGADRPDTLRGVSLTYVVLDEYADMKSAVWEQVIRASLSDKKGDAMFIGTPKGRNHFYDIYQVGANEEDDDYKSWSFTTADNELIDPTEIEAAKRTLSSFAFKSEYLASFDNAGSGMFKDEWVKYGEEPKDGSYYIAIDLAGFEEVAKQAANAKKRLDETAIAVVKATEDGKWFVQEIDHGRWDIRETAVKILMKMRKYRPISIGIERGALKNAVLPYLSDLMRKNNVYSHISDLTHGNRKKADRVIWSLQGRFEHGRIILNNKEKWTEFVDQLLMFPSQGVHDDLCFVAGTMISTPTGGKPIESFQVGDWVQTPDGNRQVTAATMTNPHAEVYALNNGELIGTGNHPIMTNNGWKDLCKLEKDDILVHQHNRRSSWLFQAKKASSKRLSFLTDIGTTATQKLRIWLTANTLPKAEVAFYIGTLGFSTTGQSLQDTMFTTRTATAQTTILPTWRVYQPRSTTLNTEKIEVKMPNAQSNWRTWRPSITWLKHGIVLKKVNSGILNMVKILGLNESRLLTLVNNAARRLSLLNLQKFSTARANVRLLLGAKNTLTITRLLEKQPVYNLTVADAKCYYANGILVHNCDALSYIDQLAVTTYFEESDEEEWEPLDIISGV